MSDRIDGIRETANRALKLAEEVNREFRRHMKTYHENDLVNRNPESPVYDLPINLNPTTPDPTPAVSRKKRNK